MPVEAVAAVPSVPQVKLLEVGFEMLGVPLFETRVPCACQINLASLRRTGNTHQYNQNHSSHISILNNEILRYFAVMKNSSLTSMLE